MKNTILTLLMGAFIGTTNASVLEAGIDGEATLNFSTSSVKNGLLLREDSFSGSVNLKAGIVGGDVNIGASLSDVKDGGNDTDIWLSYSRAIPVLGDQYVATLSYEQFDSSFGDWEQLSLGTVKPIAWVDLGAGIWKELGGSNQFGLQVSISRDLELLQEGLYFTPFVEANFAEDFNGYESGLKVQYQIIDNVFVSAKTSYKNNDAIGGYALDGKWGFGLGVTYTF